MDAADIRKMYTWNHGGVHLTRQSQTIEAFDKTIEMPRFARWTFLGRQTAAKCIRGLKIDGDNVHSKVHPILAEVIDDSRW
jgi:hypothetical protein